MSALYPLLGVLVVLVGATTGYRLWEKRSRLRRDEATAPPPIERQAEIPTPVELPGSAAKVEEAVAPTEPTPHQSLESTFKAPAKPYVEIPDPWLSDSDVELAAEAPVAEAIAKPLRSEDTISPVEDVVSSPGTTSTTPNINLSVSPTDTAALGERIASVGRTGQLHYAASIARYMNHANSGVRAAVATALGNLAANRSGTRVEALIPALGKLSQDAKPEVRVAAVEALGKIRSPQVLPWLQRLQKSSDANVRRAVTVALQRLKLTYQPKPVTKLPLNKDKKTR
jgi:hypothetical protein